MNPRQHAHFRKVLEALKAELSQDIDRTVHAMQDDATIFADPNDRASQESDIALELRNRDRERKLIKKIDETIARIDKDDYGYCENCGIEIGLKRLEVRPTSTSAVMSSIRFFAACPPSAETQAIETVPSSEISIVVPVSSCSPRMTTPPLPMTSRIFSGLILILMMRGA